MVDKSNPHSVHQKKLCKIFLVIFYQNYDFSLANKTIKKGINTIFDLQVIVFLKFKNLF